VKIVIADVARAAFVAAADGGFAGMSCLLSELAIVGWELASIRSTTAVALEVMVAARSHFAAESEMDHIAKKTVTTPAAPSAENAISSPYALPWGRSVNLSFTCSVLLSVVTLLLCIIIWGNETDL